MLLLDNGIMLIDTPGMRELGLLGASDVLDDCFSEIEALSRNCRFENCTHVREPGGAVLQAIAARQLSDERYRIYLKLRKESEHYNSSYMEKRKKDKDSGRHVKAVMKQRW